MSQSSTLWSLGLSQLHPSRQRNSRGALFASELATILASICCLGPLILLSLGISGAWIGNLTLLEPYLPIFIGVALIALFFAYRRPLRAPAVCKRGEVYATARVNATYRLLFWVVAALVVVALSFLFVAPLFN